MYFWFWRNFFNYITIFLVLVGVSLCCMLWSGAWNPPRVGVGAGFVRNVRFWCDKNGRFAATPKAPPPVWYASTPLTAFTQNFFWIFLFFSANLSQNIPSQILFSRCNSLNLKRKCVEIRVSGFWSA